MWMSCSRWYEEYLGDSCNGKCENCYGDNMNVFAVMTFKTQNTLIEKGDRFWIEEETGDSITLKNDATTNNTFNFTQDFFREHFSYQETA